MLPNARLLARTSLGWLLWPLAAKLIPRKIGGDQGLVLMFHHVGRPVLPGAEDYLFLSVAELGEVLDFVRAELCPLEPLDFLARLAAGTLPPKATMLTFDDGTVDQVSLAAPEFVKRGLKAGFFVCPGLIERGDSVPSLDLATLCQHAPAGRHAIILDAGPGEPTCPPLLIEISDQASRGQAYAALLPLLRQPSRARARFLSAVRHGLGVAADVRCDYRLATWEELRALTAAGMYVGNHTLYHSTVAADGIAQFEADVAQAYRILDQQLPPTRRIFCYPYGRAEDATAATTLVLQSHGVSHAFVVQGGLARPVRTGPWNLHREAVSYNIQAAKLAALLALFR
ncbi:MAG: hypothetical protein CVT63_03590 [Candidatus Anoxymicrobium japonicum]|uniref:NodB homology domain-containing protein n=1 Tax=Candidatus Anoxymicrobium japonicum TaxID=2013648 RepID=A0A2N3G6E2_9ACTN|nr:MAG: hypothetical protein CVT63_03590 [Candidatus Anoxymicrobium japonicum]